GWLSQKARALAGSMSLARTVRNPPPSRFRPRPASPPPAKNSQAVKAAAGAERIGMAATLTQARRFGACLDAFRTNRDPGRQAEKGPSMRAATLFLVAWGLALCACSQPADEAPAGAPA